ncbi:MAG: prepilin peptidase [Tissierellia bacterium]|nr:prepilin peptidase [Tissierellia bacterium]
MKMIPAISIIIGMIMGSFLHLVALRRSRGISIISPSSHCFNCKRILKPFSLIPVFSYIIQKGKCRYCGEEIGIGSFFAEIIMPLSYICLYFKFGLSAKLFMMIYLVSVLYIMSITDILEKNIFDIDLVFLFIAAFIYLIYAYFYKFFDMRIGIIQLFLFGLYFIVKRLEKPPLAEGDILVYIALLTFLNIFEGILFIFSSFWIAAIVLIALIKMKSLESDKIPFIPFIAISFFLVILLGEDILKFMGWL